MKKKYRKFGNVLLKAIINDIDGRNIVLELSLDNHGIFISVGFIYRRLQDIKRPFRGGKNIVEMTFRRPLK